MARQPKIGIDKSTISVTDRQSGEQAVSSVYNQLENELGKTAQIIENEGVRVATDEGRKAVTRDEEGNLQVDKMHFGGRIADAYNSAAMQNYLVQKSGDVRSMAHELRTNNPTNSASFEAAWQEFSKKTIENAKAINPGMARSLEGPLFQMLQREGASVSLGIQRRKQQIDLRNFSNNTKAEISLLNDELAALAAGDGVGTDRYLEKQTEVKDLLENLVKNPESGVTARQAEIQLRRMSDNHKGLALVSSIEKAYRDDGIAAAETRIKQIESDADLALSPVERRRYAAQARQKIAQINAERRALLGPVKDEASNIFKALEAGAKVNDSEVDQVVTNLAKLGDAKGAMKLIRKRTQNKVLGPFGGMNNVQQRQTYEQALDAENARWTYDRHGLEFYKPSDLMGRKGDKNAWIHSATAAAADRVGKAFFDLTGKRIKVNVEQNPLLTAGIRRGTRSPDDNPGATNSLHLHGRALDFQIRGLSDQEKAQFLQVALKSGFTGIGFYSDRDGGHLHLDTGKARMFFGKNTPNEVPAWAQSALDQNWSRNKKNLRGDVDPVILKEMKKEIVSDAKNALRDFKSGLLKGAAPGNEDLANLKASVAILGDGDMTQEFAALVNDKKVVEQFKKLNLTQKEIALDRARQNEQENGFDDEGIDSVSAMERIYRETLTGLKKDPMGLGVDRGVIPPTDPLDFSNAENLMAGLQKREEQAAKVSAFYNNANVLPLRPQEVEALRREFKNRTPAEKSQFYSALSQGLSPKSYQATMTALAKDEGAKINAIAGMLHQRSPELGEAIVRGNQLLKDDPGYGFKNDALSARQIEQYLPKEAFGLKMVKSRQNFIDAARALYADLSETANDKSGRFNALRMKEALDAVTGNILTFNDKKIVAPVPGMDQALFDDLMSAISDEELVSAVTDSGKPFTAEDLRKHGRLRAIGDGMYLIQYGDETDPQFVKTPRGEPYEIDLKDIAEELE